MTLTTTVLILVALLASANVHAGVIDESTAGDFSDHRFQPTSIVLDPGMTTIRGRSGISSIPDVPDLDYVTFTVPARNRLERFMLSAASVGGAFSFIGLEAGPIISIPADWTDVNNPMLGWTHFGSADVGRDLLPLMAKAPGSVGFTPPLGPGVYALWIMELDTSEAHSYEFQLCVETDCLGDGTGDDMVDGTDLAIVLSLWGTTGAETADLDGNGTIDGGDLALLLANWGPCPR
jgi:hypothetical protein